MIKQFWKPLLVLFAVFLLGASCAVQKETELGRRTDNSGFSVRTLSNGTIVSQTDTNVTALVPDTNLGTDLGADGLYWGTLFVNTTTISGVVSSTGFWVADDNTYSAGNTVASPDFTLRWLTSDANANHILLTVPEGGAVNVPVFALGDASATADLGLFDGITDPTLAILSPDNTRWLKLSVNDSGVATYDASIEATIATNGSIRGRFSSSRFLVLDDYSINLGDSNDAQWIWETADADANAFLLTFPAGDATNVPVMIVGDRGGVNPVNTDLGLFNGITEPTVAILNSSSTNPLKLSSTIINFPASDSEIQRNGTPYWSQYAASQVFNENGGNIDFRIETQSIPSMFFLDASKNSIGIATSTPSSTLEIYGGWNRLTRTVTASTTVNLNEGIIWNINVDDDINLTLGNDFIEQGSGDSMACIYIKDQGGYAATRNIGILTEGAQTINGNATSSLESGYQSLEICCNGSNCWTY